jgi:UDP-N-acetylmuramoyl-L-alanyl-D-glutamate--2,6-diaminopimelate ligase
MTQKSLSGLVKDLPGLRIRGNPDTLISGLAYDSRAVQEGWLFFALEGLHINGNDYIPQALKAGAAAVVYGAASGGQAAEAARGAGTRGQAVFIQAENPRAAMSGISANFYGRPSSRLKTIGVTGTDGKSSTVYFIYQLLEALGKKAGLLSTVSFLTDGGFEKNTLRQSTPEAPVIHGILADMEKAGKEYAVIEATSHGLSPRTGRLLDVEFDVAVLTNVTHEHLEFHGSQEQYLSDKTNLFRCLQAGRSAKKGVPAFGVTNADDSSYAYIKTQVRERLYSYSVRSSADIYASGLRADSDGCGFTLHDGGEKAVVRIQLPGAFNVENVLAAAAAVSRILGIPAVELAPHIAELKGVRGRMTPVRGAPFAVLVDYAHTPGSFERLFPVVRAATAGRIIAVFGSGGERDTEKRPIQGRIAAAYAAQIILADEDPRGEDPRELLLHIAAGTGRTEGDGLLIIPDRGKAIARAFELAGPGDTVLLLGKGHESSIIYKGGPIPWDEIEVAEKLLQKYR